jgi:hypothetical protein
MPPLRALLAISALLYAVSPAFAQTTPPPSSSQDDTPSIHVGAVLFPNYTYTVDPTTTDTDGNRIHFNQFNLTRGFLNITGKLSHVVEFRLTPDVARETSAFSDIAGSLELRLVYAYAQINLGDWMTKGTYARFGIVPTPWLDFAEGIYRYRFQGAMFAEREGYLSLADAGASFHLALPSDFGEIEVGAFNGEGFNGAEVNNEKSLQVRGTLRPFASAPPDSVLHGIRGTLFYDADRYVKDGPRNRFIASVTVEHAYLNAGFEFLDAADRTSVTKPESDGRGYSVWLTPRTRTGLEGLLRYDHLKPNTLAGALLRTRTIAGLAYWFPHQGSVASALLVDYDGQKIENAVPPQPNTSRIGVHGLISF